MTQASLFRDNSFWDSRHLVLAIIKEKPVENKTTTDSPSY